MTVRPLLWFWLLAEVGLLWFLTQSIWFTFATVFALRFVTIAILTSFSAWASQAPRLSPFGYLRLWFTETFAFILFFSFFQLLPRQFYERHSIIADNHVVLIHGFFCNAGMWFFLQRKLQQSEMSTSVVEMPRLFGSLNEFSALISDEVHRIQQQAPSANVTVIAFSMSGLAARLAKVCERTPSFNLLTVNTPHNGTKLALLAKWVGSLNGKQMMPGSDFIVDLEQREQWAGSEYHSYWSSHDTIIVPATSAISGADDTCYGANGHIYSAIDSTMHQQIIRQIKKVE